MIKCFLRQVILRGEALESYGEDFEKGSAREIYWPAAYDAPATYGLNGSASRNDRLCEERARPNGRY